MWTRDEALRFINSVQAKLMADGWFLALAGGVLNKGYSEHDLDLVAVPMKSQYAILKHLHFGLAKVGCKRTHDAETMRAHWKAKGSPDDKYVEVYQTPDGKRIDIIVAYPGVK